MKSNFKILIFTLVAISGLYLSSTDCSAQVPIENQLLNLFQKTDLEKNVIIITSLSDNKVEYTTQQGWKPGQDDAKKRGGDIICQGSGHEFAKCVQSYVVRGGKCLVYKYKNGDLYVAHIMK